MLTDCRRKSGEAQSPIGITAGKGARFSGMIRMKRIISFIMATVLMLAAMPALAVLPQASRVRTTLLDLSNTTSSASSAEEGWAFDPTGYNGKPQLTLDSYGTAGQHGAPIIVPKDTRILVSGDCYIDNACMGEEHDVLSGCPDGYLIIDGTGTLNLYAQSYLGCCLTLPNGGENVDAEYLYINNVTVNCYGTERDMYNVMTKLKACIYSNHNIEIHNAVINTDQGKWGIKAEGFTPIGGTTEDNCNEILIDNSVVNIQNMNDAGYYNYAHGIRITYGKIRITGASDVTINAGSESVYSRHSFTVDGGRVKILSRPHASTETYALIYCKCLMLKDGLESFYVGTTAISNADVLRVRDEGTSTLGSGLTVRIGSFENGNYIKGTDPDNNNMPAIYVTPDSVTTHTVRFYGFGGELLSTVEVPDGGAAQAPEAASSVTAPNGLYRFRRWDKPFDNITEDTDVYAEYGLVGDVNCDGTVDMRDVTALNAYLVNCGEVTELGLFNADVSGSDGVTAYDSTLIAMISLGIALP